MSRTLRLAAALAVACLAFLGMAGVANALTYTGGAITTGQNVPPGSADVLSGTGFTPDTTVTVTLGAEVLGSVLVAPDGTFSLSYTTPTACGSYTITATNGIETQTTTLTVACATTPAGSLPYTGNDSSLPARPDRCGPARRRCDRDADRAQAQPAPRARQGRRLSLRH